ncbi:MAG TPA: hypothetical protein VKR55_24780 [Bradyrhizobium sp.]|uniref:hypothetical protein n=1 Tax=Bradyrhizobium sp. TaxID=376 RepID=UPI002B693C44|nr:hypothetical protein [Bradyrhizobium sp.]HLZ05350.1 hypothetical protein [Bradyrhizobium sp.]
MTAISTLEALVQPSVRKPLRLSQRKEQPLKNARARKRPELDALAPKATDRGVPMRTSIFAIIAVAGSAIAFPAMAEQQPRPQQQAAPSEQTPAQMHQDQDKALKGGGQTSQTGAQMQREADSGIKTRNSGESGYVAYQDKPGASAHPPGRPESGQTTGLSKTYNKSR